MRLENETSNEQVSAKKIVQMLEDNLVSIDALTAAKLKYAREKALSKIPASGFVVQDGVLHSLGTAMHNQKVWFALAALLMALSLFFVAHEGVQSVNQSDAYLLGSDLPPEIYLNEGFDEWLLENSKP